LLGERNIVEGVAAAVEADHEAVTDQLVLSHAFDIREVLDPRGGMSRGSEKRQREKRYGDDPDHARETNARHPLLPAEVRLGCATPMTAIRLLTMRDACHRDRSRYHIVSIG